MDEKTEALLAGAGWEVECWSPFEIRHEDGSFARGSAAQAVVDALQAPAS